VRENRRFEGLSNDGHTTGTRFSNTRGKPDSLIDRIAYLFVECRTITRCTRVGKTGSHMIGRDYDPTHHTATRTDIPSGSTCSILPVQKGGVLL